MTEIVTLHTPDRSNVLKELFKDVPWGECEKKGDVITGRIGWRAPDGKIFRVSGQFLTERISDGYSKPQYDKACPRIPSSEVLISQNREKYKGYLQKTLGNKSKSLLYLSADISKWFIYNTPPTMFQGKWLEIGFVGDEVNVRVAQEVKARMVGVGELSRIKWEQRYVDLILGFSNIEVINYREPKKKLFCPEMDMNYVSDRTSEDWVAWWEKLTKRQYIGEERERLREDFFNDARSRGHQLKDDPLLGFSFVKPDELIVPEGWEENWEIIGVKRDESLDEGYDGIPF